jgi:hypothetical protein
MKLCFLGRHTFEIINTEQGTAPSKGLFGSMINDPGRPVTVVTYKCQRCHFIKQQFIEGHISKESFRLKREG